MGEKREVERKREKLVLSGKRKKREEEISLTFGK